MPDRTKYRSSHNPWIIGYPYLPPDNPEVSATRKRRERPSWIVRLRCRLHRDGIDHELAAGADPDSSECRHRRAAELTAASERRRLAADYERLVARAATSTGYGIVPVDWRGVRAAAPRLEAIAQKLREDQRVRPQGVARARLLLTDGASSLYLPHGQPNLAAEVRSALALL